MGADPLNSLPRFEAFHLEQRRDLLRYLTNGRGRHGVDEEAYECLLDRSARSLKAINAQARIAVARSMDHAMREAFEGVDGPVFWITLTPARFARALPFAREFEEQTLITWTGSVLNSGHFVASVDAGYYSNRGGRSAGSGAVVSWHVHGLWWGVSENSVRVRFSHVEEAERPLVAGRRVTHFKAYSCATARRKKLPYMLKAPLKDYRVFDKPGRIHDPRINDLVNVFTGEETQKKRDLRTGDAWRMCRVMGTRTIADLVFAGGDGEDIVERAFDLARTSIDGSDAARNEAQKPFSSTRNFEESSEG